METEGTACWEVLLGLLVLQAGLTDAPTEKQGENE